ncbi:MAG: M6 family metalloprotease domain-containing protein [Gemmatimonadota bacterium]
MIRICITSLLLATWLCVPKSVAAQDSYPRALPGEFEVRGLDFRPDGAWRRRTDAIRLFRRRLLRSGTLAALNAHGASATRVTGAFLVPVIPIAFSNVPAGFPETAYQDVLFNPVPSSRPYSVTTFYAQMSLHNVSIDGQVQPWVTADSADSYYEDGCNGIGVVTPCPHGFSRLGEFLLEGLRKNDTGALDWGRFDNDGPDGLPNSGDDDGFVDFVTFLHPDVDGACKTPHLWAHRYVISSLNGGSPYVTHSPRRDASGSPVPGQFIKVQDYTLQSGQGGDDACTAGLIMPIGTIAHETGHAFGLPDLYDTSPGAGPHTEGIGEWGLMGSGNYALPYSPSRFEAWSLAELGWISIDTLRANQTIHLAPVALSDTVLYIPVPGTNEFFLLENRQALGSDSAQMNPAFKHPKGPGLLIWHIDGDQVSAHGFRRGGNTVNAGAIHGVALVQADGLDQLEIAGLKNRGDAGDPFPGRSGNRTFSPTSNPAALDNRGNTAGFTIDSIYEENPGGSVVIRYSVIPAGVVTVTVAQATAHLLGTATLGAAQLGYLDGIGNHNGGYDLGDYLAFLRVMGIVSGTAALPPGIVTKNPVSHR